jgi:hypothetical protein
VPVGAPLVGMATAAVAMVAGLWLILAPRAFDFQHGREFGSGHRSSGLPTESLVDLVTGTSIVIVGLAALSLFGIAARRRLRAAGVLARARVPAPASAYDDTAPASHEATDQPTRQAGEPLPAGTIPEPTAAPTEAGGDLRDLRELLAPLVTALAEDLRSRQQPRDTAMPPRGRSGGVS